MRTSAAFDATRDAWEDGQPSADAPGLGSDSAHRASREAEAKAFLPLIDMTQWQGDPPPRQSLWGHMLPLHQTTMLTGAGGVGKSLFEQALLTHVALGRPFLGLTVEQRNCLFVTCEDDAAELWRRQTAICAALGVPVQAVLGKLYLCSLTGEPNTALATFDDTGLVRPTERWHALERTCEVCDVGLYAFDNATDAMAGDLNDIHQVAEFVNLLTGLAIRRNGVAMIIHHPNKRDDEWLGSVAWHNKVRSRLIIERPSEDDPDARVIKNPKANYGPSGGEIAFRWHRGTFLRDEDLPQDYAAALAETVKASSENAAFLGCLRARAAQGEGRLVGPSPGPNYAPTQFEGMPEAKRLKREALKRAMDRLYAIGAIETHTYRNTSKGRDVTIIREASEPSPNCFPNASRTRFPNLPELDPELPPAHTIDTTYQSGGAADAGPPADDESEAAQ